MQKQYDLSKTIHTMFRSVSFLFVSTVVLLLRIATCQEDLVSTTCSQTPFSDTCSSSLRSDPRSQNSDIKGLATIALEKSIEKATETKAHIDYLIKLHNPNQTEYELKCLKECMAEYSEALDNLQESYLAFNTSSFDTVNSDVAAAMSDAESCENGYEEEQLLQNPSPLTERNKIFSELCSNFLAITTLI